MSVAHKPKELMLDIENVESTVELDGVDAVINNSIDRTLDMTKQILDLPTKIDKGFQNIKKIMSKKNEFEKSTLGKMLLIEKPKHRSKDPEEK